LASPSASLELSMHVYFVASTWHDKWSAIALMID
jgi:hypothetical protein